MSLDPAQKDTGNLLEVARVLQKAGARLVEHELFGEGLGLFAGHQYFSPSLARRSLQAGQRFGGWQAAHWPFRRISVSVAGSNSKIVLRQRLHQMSRPPSVSPATSRAHSLLLGFPGFCPPQLRQCTNR